MIDRWIRAFAFKTWQLGFFGALRFASGHFIRHFKMRSIRQQILTGTTAPSGRDIFHTYAMVLHQGFKSTKTDKKLYENDTINWIVPPFSPGSGGHLNIFRMINMLEEQGYKNRIYIAGNSSFNNGLEARQQIIESFSPIQAEVHLGIESLEPAEFIFATSWDTAYWVQHAMTCKHRLYFVQDFEPFFYPHGSEYAFAEATYRMGLIGITAGKWLSDTLQRDYGMMAAPFGFSYDKHLYFPHPRDNGARRVFFYARHVTPRRGFELGLLALNALHLSMPNIEFILAGWDTSEFKVPFPHLNAGVVSLDQLPGLYSQCDVALVLSFTNLSLLPLEVMACGCPVVSNRGPNTEWLLADGENALLCDPTPQGIADTLERLLTDETLRQQIIQSGLRFAQTTDWPAEGKRVANYLSHMKQHGTLGS